MNPQPNRFKPLLTGAGALLLSAACSSAAITWSGVLDIAIPTNFAGVYLDLAVPGGDPTEPSGGGVAAADSYTIGYTAPTTWDVNLFFGGVGMAYSDTFQPARANGADFLSRVLNVAPDTTVDTSLIDYLGVGGVNATFGGSGQANGSTVGESHFGVAPDTFQPGQPGNIAFVLDPQDATPLYGWIRVTLTDDGTPGTIHEWAYSDTPITVGAIPEPGSVALLLVGAVLLRRRRV